MSKIYIIEKFEEWDGGYYSADVPLENAPFFRTEKAAQLYLDKLLAVPMTDYSRIEWTNHLSIRAFDTKDHDGFLANFIKERKEEQLPKEPNPREPLSGFESNVLETFLDTPVPILYSLDSPDIYGDDERGWEKGATVTTKVAGMPSITDFQDIYDTNPPKKT